MRSRCGRERAAEAFLFLFSPNQQITLHTLTCIKAYSVTSVRITYSYQTHTRTMNATSRMLSVCMVVLSSMASAQPKTAPSWSAKFKTPITWQRVHSLGYLIVNTGDGLYGVNPDDGKILWENKGFASLNPEFYQEVDGTEFLTIAYQGDKASTIPIDR